MIIFRTPFTSTHGVKRGFQISYYSGKRAHTAMCFILELSVVENFLKVNLVVSLEVFQELHD